MRTGQTADLDALIAFSEAVLFKLMDDGQHPISASDLMGHCLKNGEALSLKMKVHCL